MLQPIYSKQPFSLSDLAMPSERSAPMGSKLTFVGLDLAPSETMESGFVALNRHRGLLRSEKVFRDADIIRALESLGPLHNTVLVIDVPKSLNIPGKFRREEIQMHVLRLMRETLPDTGFPEITPRPRMGRPRFYKGKPVQVEIQDNEAHVLAHRTARRARTLYDALLDAYPAMTTLLSYNALAKQRYGLHVPFKARSTAGAKCLQTAIATQLYLPDVEFPPTQCLPLAILDAMVTAYASWSLYSGQEGQHYSLYQDEDTRRFLEPLERVPEQPVRYTPRRRYRR